jgi:hypothetical protein
VGCPKAHRCRSPGPVDRNTGAQWGYTALFNNALDWMSRPNGFPSGMVGGLISASPGLLGGVKSKLALQIVLGKMGYALRPRDRQSAGRSPKMSPDFGTSSSPFSNFRGKSRLSTSSGGTRLMPARIIERRHQIAVRPRRSIAPGTDADCDFAAARWAEINPGRFEKSPGIILVGHVELILTCVPMSRRTELASGGVERRVHAAHS